MLIGQQGAPERGEEPGRARQFQGPDPGRSLPHRATAGPISRRSLTPETGCCNAAAVPSFHRCPQEELRSAAGKPPLPKAVVEEANGSSEQPEATRRRAEVILGSR